MNTSERLKYIRQQTGLSQSQFADFLKEKTSRINSIEAGKQVKFPYDLAEKILQSFPEYNYNFKWLITGIGNPNIDNTNALIRLNNQELSLKSEKIIEKLSNNITDAEFELIVTCLKEKKELSILLLKKLLENEKEVKLFLLED